MHYVPFTVIKSIHEQTHSAMPNAPLRPHVPKRHPIRDAVARWRERRTPPKVELTLVCQAEDRDRGTTPEGVARAC
ncbi:hypothetical protein ACFV9C_17065 [Kribbella sp. NPDC059898]|uniref:hypothetical protein n=1 Tax=Kribbella sp. NPDC059898 TaxID=3346995 RepID=UPI00364DAB2B